MSTLTINACPESSLPELVTGDVALIEQITIANVKSFEINNASDYEENCDGEYRIVLNNGDEIHFDGYTGMWELEHYNHLSNTGKNKFLKSFREQLSDTVADMDGAL
jgi:hypothetical protein